MLDRTFFEAKLVRQFIKLAYSQARLSKQANHVLTALSLVNLPET